LNHQIELALLKKFQSGRASQKLNSLVESEQVASFGQIVAMSARSSGSRLARGKNQEKGRNKNIFHVRSESFFWIG
jgi:hypothetical protein